MAGDRNGLQTVEDWSASEWEPRLMERKMQSHVWALLLVRLELLKAYLMKSHPASVGLTERGPTMKLPLASLMIQEREGRTGANRAEDWSARPPQELGTRQCYGRCCGAGGER